MFTCIVCGNMCMYAKMHCSSIMYTLYTCECEYEIARMRSAFVLPKITCTCLFKSCRNDLVALFNKK